MKAKRIIANLLVLITVVSLFSGLTPSASAASAKPITYKLTGNYRDDIVGVALTQEGNTGNPYCHGTSKCNKWCADFIGWCARKANIPTNALPNSHNVAGYWENYSGSTLTYKFHMPGEGYKPRKGDLIIFRVAGNGTIKKTGQKYKAVGSISHVGIVREDCSYVFTASSTNTVKTIEGNHGGKVAKVNRPFNKVTGFVSFTGNSTGPSYTTTPSIGFTSAASWSSSNCQKFFTTKNYISLPAGKKWDSILVSINNTTSGKSMGVQPFDANGKAMGAKKIFTKPGEGISIPITANTMSSKLYLKITNECGGVNVGNSGSWTGVYSNSIGSTTSTTTENTPSSSNNVSWTTSTCKIGFTTKKYLELPAGKKWDAIHVTVKNTTSGKAMNVQPVDEYGNPLSDPIGFTSTGSLRIPVVRNFSASKVYLRINNKCGGTNVPNSGSWTGTFTSSTGPSTTPTPTPTPTPALTPPSFNAYKRLNENGKDVLTLWADSNRLGRDVKRLDENETGAIVYAYDLNGKTYYISQDLPLDGTHYSTIPSLVLHTLLDLSQTNPFLLALFSTLWAN